MGLAHKYFMIFISAISVVWIVICGCPMMANSMEDSPVEGGSAVVSDNMNSNQKSFLTNLTGWYGLNGSWNIDSNGYRGSGGGDNWAICDKQLAGNDAFVYEADVQMTKDQYAAGLIFGVKDPVNPSGRPGRWYCMNVVKKGNVSNVFTQLNGATEWNDSRPLTDAERETDQYHFRIEYLGNKQANFYLNGTLVVSRELPDYSGGYLGLMVYEAAACFENVNCTPATPPKLDGLELIGADIARSFDPAVHTYWADVPCKAKSVKIKAVAANIFKLQVNSIDAFSGKDAVLELVDGLNTISVKVSDPKTGLSDTYTINVVRAPDPKTIYKEITRPQFHFTPYMFQMNDPNGLVYNEVTKEYHLYFQCNRPFDTGLSGLPGSGTTSWGHAVSKDLVNWQELPLALTPDKLGTIWSGSCVIDRGNSSGLFDESTPAGARMVAFYTNAGGDMAYGFGKESLAYSKDGGLTWIKYPGNPILRNPKDLYGGGLRDPKVIWYADKSMPAGGIWVMVTAIDSHIFTSHNLIDWSHSGPLKDKHGKPFEAECPDLFPLAVDGDTSNVKWVFSAAGVFYLIGHMENTGEDKLMFVPETDKIEPLKGVYDLVHKIPVGEPYAAQSFFNDPRGRRISISWLRDKYMKWKDKTWESAQSLPLEMKLRTIDGKLCLTRYPVIELNKIRDGKPVLSLRNQPVDVGDANLLKGINATMADIEATITLGTATEVSFKLRVGSAAGGQEVLVKYDRKQNMLIVDKSKTDPGYVALYSPEMGVLDGNKLKLRILLDQTCIDVFGNDGEAAVSGLVYSEFENAGMEILVNGTATIDSLDIYKVKRMKRRLPGLR